MENTFSLNKQFIQFVIVILSKCLVLSTVKYFIKSGNCCVVRYFLSSLSRIKNSFQILINSKIVLNIQIELKQKFKAACSLQLSSFI